MDDTDEIEFRPDSPDEDLLLDSFGKPFERCVDCGEDLGLRAHAIERHFRDGECVFEFAICSDCAETGSGELSEDSREALLEFVASRRSQARGPRSCCLCAEARPAEAMGDHSIVAYRIAGLGAAPMMICDSCTEEMQELLSEQTRGWMDDFRSRNFPGVPEGLDQPLLLPF